jgi:hypothetical protein
MAIWACSQLAQRAICHKSKTDRTGAAAAFAKSGVIQLLDRVEHPPVGQGGVPRERLRSRPIHCETHGDGDLCIKTELISSNAFDP